MRNELVIALLVVLAIAGYEAGFYVGNGSRQTVAITSTSLLTTTSTTTATTTYVRTSAIPTVEMIALVSPQTITTGQNVSVTFGAYNALSTPVAINVTGYANRYLGPCYNSLPVTYYIYSGHVTFSDLVSSSPLLLYNNSFPITCFRSYNSTWTFQPHSDNATMYAAVLDSTSNVTVNFTVKYSGFWTQGAGLKDSFNAFAAGQYSVLVNDTPGQQELEYFTVNP